MSKVTKNPVLFAVNVTSNKQSIELQQTAFKHGYKWETDSEHYNNIDESVFQGYGKYTCFIFDYKKKFISFCKINDIRYYPNTLLYTFSDWDLISSLFRDHQNFWEEQEFEMSLLQSDIKDRMIL